MKEGGNQEIIDSKVFTIVTYNNKVSHSQQQQTSHRYWKEDIRMN